MIINYFVHYYHLDTNSINKYWCTIKWNLYILLLAIMAKKYINHELKEQITFKKKIVIKIINEIISPIISWLQKLVSSFLRATALPYPELGDWRGIAGFVADHLALDPLKPPTQLVSTHGESLTRHNKKKKLSNL